MSTQYATFYVGKALWAVHVLQVREILKNHRISTVPHASPHVRGLMNLRGQIVTALDVRSLLGLPWNEEAGRVCLVLKTDSELARVRYAHPDIEDTGVDPVGLLVDDVGDVVTVEDDSLDLVPGNVDERFRPFLRGVLRLDGQLMLVLRLTPVFEGAL